MTIVPAIRAILDSPDMRIDGFIGPGHVSTVIGCRPYEWIARSEGKPVVTSGFEPLDLLQSIVMLLQQLHAGEARVENQYKRVVPWEGNSAALRAMAEVLNCAPTLNGAALDLSPNRRLRIRDKYAAWDAENRYSVAADTGHGSEIGTVRRSAERCLETGTVQVVRKGVHS